MKLCSFYKNKTIRGIIYCTSRIKIKNNNRAIVVIKSKQTEI